MIRSSKKLKISLPERIADELRYSILTGSIPKNEFLNEIALSERYGVSRGSIRQAILLLSSEGLVETLANGRTKVTGFSTNEMTDYYQTRLFLESEAVKKIVRLPEDAAYRSFIAELTEIADSFRTLQPQFDYETINQLDIEFHFHIIELVGTQITKQIWKSLANINRTFMSIRKILIDHSLLFEDNLDITLDSHARIISCLSSRDLDSLLAELQWHINNSIDIYTNILNNISHLN